MGWIDDILAFLIIIFPFSCITFIVSALGYLYAKSFLGLKGWIKMSIPYCYESVDDTGKDRYGIPKFLYERAKMSLKVIERPDSAYKINVIDKLALEELSPSVIHFIRLCHELGCEVVIRQIGYDDLEKKENTPEVIAEYISHSAKKMEKELSLSDKAVQELYITSKITR